MLTGDSTKIQTPQNGLDDLRSFPARDALVGRVLQNGYRLEERIGEGGMGVVYRATQITLGRAVAIKLIHPDGARCSTRMERFFREARLLSQLSHPNIVQVIDFGSEPGPLYYMVMEYLQGETLERFVHERKLVVAELVIELMDQIVAAMTAAHQMHVIHRDLKPSNVYLASVTGGGPPVVKVLDFGLAKGGLAEGADGRNGLTQEGTIMGTCGYAAPEQMNGISADERSDIYSLGAVLYFLVAGRPPFRDEGVRNTLMKQLTALPDPLTAEGLTPRQVNATERVIHKAMSINPANRYANAAELLVELHAALLGHGETVRERKRTGRYRVVRPTSATVITPPESGPVTPPTVREVLPSPVEPPAPGPQSRRPARSIKWAGIAVGLAICTTLAGWQGFRGRGHSATLPGATAPGVTATEIILGMSGPFSGPNRDMGRAMQVGIETALHEINDGGGLHGRRLRLVALDDAYEPDRARNNTRELLDKHDVFAFVGNVGTPTTEASLPVILEQRRILFNAFSGGRHLRREPPDRYVFNFRASYDDELAALVRYLVEVRKVAPARIAVFAQDDSFGEAGVRGLVRSLRHYGDKTDEILHVSYHRNTSDVASAVQRIVAARPAAVVMIATARPAARFIQQVKDAGLNVMFANVSFVSSESLVEALRERGEKYLPGVIVTQVVPRPHSSATGVLRFREQLARHFPAERPGFTSLEGYITARILARGIEQAGPDLTSETLVDALERIREQDLGIGVAVSFNSSNHNASRKVWATVLDAKGQHQDLDLE
jgi:serine/threonine protein kinase